MLIAGKHHIFPESIAEIITPTDRGGQGGVVVVFVSGREEPFFGAEADQVREWLASQQSVAPTSHPATIPITTKIEPPKPAPAKPAPVVTK